MANFVLNEGLRCAILKDGNNYLLLDSVEASEPQELAAFVVFFLRLPRNIHNGHTSLQNLASTSWLIGSDLKTYIFKNKKSNLKNEILFLSCDERS